MMEPPRYGILGYTLLWYLALMFGGHFWAAIPAYIIAYPIACAVQIQVDKLWAIISS